jgi:hypothetical protein
LVKVATPIREYATLGGLTRAALYDGRVVTQKARDTFRASFLDGHQCRVCPAIEIPSDLPLAERQRRAEALTLAHYARIRMARTKKAAPFANGTAQEDRDVTSTPPPRAA